MVVEVVPVAVTGDVIDGAPGAALATDAPARSKAETTTATAAVATTARNGERSDATGAYLDDGGSRGGARVLSITRDYSSA